MILFNAYVLYKKSGDKLNHSSFRLDLVDKIIDKHYKPTINALKECRLSSYDASPLPKGTLQTIFLLLQIIKNQEDNVQFVVEKYFWRKKYTKKCDTIVKNVM